MADATSDRNCTPVFRRKGVNVWTIIFHTHAGDVGGISGATHDVRRLKEGSIEVETRTIARRAVCVFVSVY